MKIAARAVRAPKAASGKHASCVSGERAAMRAVLLALLLVILLGTIGQPVLALPAALFG
ncbi:MAG TPA: hypothetical protein VHD15_02000 [Hyphomicrobiales bacterium]|nr:hypothetical protein [Hyphomicrobiales bacterium]